LLIQVHSFRRPSPPVSVADNIQTIKGHATGGRPWQKTAKRMAETWYEYLVIFAIVVFVKTTQTGSQSWGLLPNFPTLSKSKARPQISKYP
jgi:hypothetical protein